MTQSVDNFSCATFPEPPAAQPALSLLDVARTVEAILVDQSLTPAERTVLALVAHQANRQHNRAYAYYDRITRESGISSSVIASALKKAAGKYLRLTMKVARGASRYALIVARPTVSSSNSEALHISSSSESETLNDRSSSQSEELNAASSSESKELPTAACAPVLRIPRFSSSESEELPEDLPEDNSPLPPKGGEREAVSPSPSADAIIAAVDSAFRAATGGGLSPKGRKDAMDEIAAGNTALLSQINAATVKAASAWNLSRKNQLFFGLKTVLGYLRQHNARAALTQPQAAGQRHQVDSAQAAAADPRVAAAKLHFSSLPAAQQDVYRAMVRSGRGGMRAEVIESLAAAKAYQDKTAGDESLKALA